MTSTARLQLCPGGKLVFLVLWHIDVYIDGHNQSPYSTLHARGSKSDSMQLNSYKHNVYMYTVYCSGLGHSDSPYTTSYIGLGQVL